MPKYPLLPIKFPVITVARTRRRHHHHHELPHLRVCERARERLRVIRTLRRRKCTRQRYATKTHRTPCSHTHTIYMRAPGRYAFFSLVLTAQRNMFSFAKYVFRIHAMQCSSTQNFECSSTERKTTAQFPYDYDPGFNSFLVVFKCVCFGVWCVFFVPFKRRLGCQRKCARSGY